MLGVPKKSTAKNFILYLLGLTVVAFVCGYYMAGHLNQKPTAIDLGGRKTLCDMFRELLPNKYWNSCNDIHTKLEARGAKNTQGIYREKVTESVAVFHYMSEPLGIRWRSLAKAECMRCMFNDKE